MNNNESSKQNKGSKRFGLTHSQRVAGYLLIYDLITTAGAYFLALLLRFDFRFSMIDPFYLIAWERFAPFYAVYCVIIFWVFRLYKSLWRFASFTELERITVATLITTVVHAIVITLNSIISATRETLKIQCFQESRFLTFSIKANFRTTKTGLIAIPG